MSQRSRAEAKRRIRETGLRATTPRVEVLALLSRSETPLSHSEVVEQLGTDDWDAATLYRNLVKLAEADLARIASRVGGIARYAAADEGTHAHTHPHFSCKSCGAVACLPEAQLTGRLGRRWTGALKAAEIQVVGDCPDCLAEQAR